MIELSTDSLTSKLKAAIPSKIGSLPKAIKNFDINSAIDGAIGDLKTNVANAVGNFKNILTGAIPKIEIPNLDPAALFGNINKELSEALTAFSGVKDLIGGEIESLTSSLTKQIDSITSGLVDTEELSNLAGSTLTNIKGAVENITNKQLKNFNLDIKNQTDFISNLTGSISDKAKEAASMLESNAQKATEQLSALTKIDDISIKIPNNLGNIEGLTEDLTTGFTELSDNLTSGLADLPGSITDNLTSGLSDLQNNLTGQLSNITGNVTSQINSTISNIQQQLPGI